jgi:hypothetical protein
MKARKSIERAMLMLVMGASFFVFFAGSCEGKGSKEPVGPVDEAEELEWQNVQLSEEEKAEFEEGKVQYESATDTGESGESETTTAGTGSGPGTVKLILKALGEEVTGTVTVMRAADNSAVDSGQNKSTYVFTLSAGTYNIDAVFHQAVDEPKLTLSNIEIAPGSKTERTFNFPMAKVKFIPVKAGTNSVVKGYKLRLKAMGGEDFYQQAINPGVDYVLISPGNYEGQLFKGSKKKEKVIDIPSIQINEGSKATKRIDVSI